MGYKVTEHNPCPKPSFPRSKPTAKQRGNITPSTRKAVQERSQGVCEKCKEKRAVEMAHIIRRWKIVGRTTDKDLIHSCIECHDWMDSCKEGREWMLEFQKKL